MTELIEVLDPKTAEPTGRTKTKANIHRDGDWHRAAHVWIITPDGRVLLQKRSIAKENHPGLWDVSTAGHVSAGETAIDAAVRETGEEIGLGIEAADLEPIGITRESHVLNGGAYIDNEVHEIFLVRRDVDLDSLRLQPGEVDEVQLVTFNQLRKIVAAGEVVEHPHEYDLLFSLPDALH